MAQEMICGRCGRRETVESAETAAICPDCGGTLLWAAPEGPTVSWMPLTEELAAYDAAAEEPADDPSLHSLIPSITPDGDTAILADGRPELEGGHRTTVVDVDPIAPTPTDPAQGSAVRPLDQSEESLPNPRITTVALPARPAGSSPTPAHSDVSIMGRAMAHFSTAPAGKPSTEGPSPLLFRIVVSYASVVTLACAYLMYLLLTRPPSLDLPDLAPPAQTGNRVTTLQYLPPEKRLPTGQHLRLGESRRYGSVTITPVRVTRGPLEFDPDEPGLEASKAPSGSVLKLHLRLENASEDQQFVPLDRRLVFTKEPDKKNFGWFKANNFVCRDDERARHDRHVLVFDLAPEGPWLIRGENLDRELPPGESVEVFVPTTEEGWETLSGPLVWRVHLRKGYNRQSLRGVTTLIEVNFNSAEIVDDRPAGGKA